MMRFLARFGSRAKKSIFWKGGILLDQGENLFFVEAHPGKNEVRVAVQGVFNHPFLAEIHEAFQEINRHFKVTEKVACCCEECQQSSSPFLFSRDKLLQHRKLGDHPLVCYESRISMTPSQLLEGTLIKREFEQYLPLTQPTTEKAPIEETPSPAPFPLFISYKRKDAKSEALIKGLQKAAPEQGFQLLIDTQEINYMENIEEFMERLSQADYIVIILSRDYLRSEHCLFELTEIAKYGKFFERVFPIVLEDAGIYDPLGRMDVINDWSTKIAALQGKLNLDLLRAQADGFQSLNRWLHYLNSIGEILEKLSKRNTLTPDELSAQNFRLLFCEIRKRIKANPKGTAETTKPKTSQT